MRRFSNKSPYIFSLLIWLTSTAHAQIPESTPIDEFDQHYQTGESLYQAGWYLAAAERLEAAYRLRPVPALLINIGQAFRKANLPKVALSYYERFFQVEPNPSSEIRAEVDSFIAQARASLADQEKKVHAEPAKPGRFGFGLYVEGGGGPTPTESVYQSGLVNNTQGHGLLGSSHNTLLTGAGAYWTYQGQVKIGISLRGGKIIGRSDNADADPTIVDVILPEICFSTGRRTWWWNAYIGLTGPQGCLRPMVSYIDGHGAIGGMEAIHNLHGWGGGVEGQLSPFAFRVGPTSGSALLMAYLSTGIVSYPKGIEAFPGGIQVDQVGKPITENFELRIPVYLSFGLKLAFESFPMGSHLGNRR